MYILLANKALHHAADTWASTGDALGDGTVHALAIGGDGALYAGGELPFLYQANKEEKIGGSIRDHMWCMRSFIFSAFACCQTCACVCVCAYMFLRILDFHACRSKLTWQAQGVCIHGHMHACLHMRTYNSTTACINQGKTWAGFLPVL
jgi:hypothetical protein